MSDWSPQEAWFISVKEDGTIDRDWPRNTEDATGPQERLMGDGCRIVKVTPVSEARESIVSAERRDRFPGKESIELMREEARHGDVETERELEEITDEMREYAEDLLDRIGEGR